MTPIRLLIVEDNVLQRDLCAAMLEARDDIQVIYTANDGADALQGIRQLKPDVVLFDMVMPHLDGFALLEQVHRLPDHAQPAMIALTSLGRDDFISRAVALGVDDYLVKPIEADQLAQRIVEIYAGRLSTRISAAKPAYAVTAGRPQHDKTAAAVWEAQPQGAEDEAMPLESIRKYAAMLLMQLDMPAHLHGYRYLMEAVVLAVQTPSVVNRMTAELYPAIAASCGATASRVERSIRNAVAITWDRGGGAAFNRILGRSAAAPAEKPANNELIAQLAARIRMRDKR